MATDTWSMIEDRVKSMSERNKRMDDTAHLLQWDDSPYELVKPDGKTKLRDAISITPNLPKVFAHGVIADLMGGKWQTVVEGNVSKRQAHMIETFVDDGLAQADEWLITRYGMPSVFSFLCNHVCIRWAIGVRCTSQIVDGEYQVEIMPVDMRWTPFVMGKWVAPRNFHDKYTLEQELEDYEKRAKDERIGEYTKANLAEKNESRDYYDNKKHELWVNKKLVYTEPNPLGYPPFPIVIPSSGFMLRDEGYLKHEGEDILFLNAGLYKEYARSISLEQTSGYAGLYPAFEREVKNPTGGPSQPVPNIDESLDVPEGERHLPVPRGDINRAGQTARQDLQQMIGDGAPLSPRQYNTPPSAILLAGEAEMISRLQNTRKEALGTLRSQLARMMIKQLRDLSKGKTELKVGKTGQRSKYSAAKMGDPDEYSISYHLSVKSKRQELANLVEFVSAYDKLPLQWNLTNVLMVDDPEGIMNDLELQKAKQINPAIGLLEMALKYARAANDTEDDIEAEAQRLQSKILTHEYVMAMRQRLQPAQPPAPQIEEPKGNTNLLASMGAGAMNAEAGQGQQQRREEVNV